MDAQTDRHGLFTTWALLHQAYALLYKTLDLRLGTLGISQAQAAVLVVLKSVDAPLPLSRLARLLAQEPQSVTSLVDRLEAQGLVQRVPSQQDRRVRYAQLTPAGEQRFAEIGPVIGEGLTEVLSVLTSQEWTAFDKALRQLRTRGTEALHLDQRVFDEAERAGTFAPQEATQPVASA